MKSKTHRPFYATLIGLSLALGATHASAHDANDDRHGCEGDHAKGKHAKRGKRFQKRFERADKNGDGFLTADEVGEERWQRLGKADKNGDAKVSRDELKAAKKARMQKRKNRKKDAERRN